MKLAIIFLSLFCITIAAYATEAKDIKAMLRQIQNMNSSDTSCPGSHSPLNTAILQSPQQIELDTELLGDYEKSGDLPCAPPYKMIFEKDGHTLVFLAVSHLAGPESLDSDKIKTLRSSIENFRPDNVIVEVDSHGRDFQKESLTKRFSDCIARNHFTCGEGLYSAKIAQDLGANVRGGEPDDSITNEYLLKKFKKEDLLGYRSIQTVLTISRSGRPPDKWPEEFQKVAEHDPLISEAKWSYKDFSKWLKKNMNSIPSEVRSDWLRPDSKSTMISQRISSGEDPSREPYITRQIGSALNRGSKTLVIYGSGHALVQRPVYEKFFGGLKLIARNRSSFKIPEAIGIITA